MSRRVWRKLKISGVLSIDTVTGKLFFTCSTHLRPASGDEKDAVLLCQDVEDNRANFYTMSAETYNETIIDNDGKETRRYRFVDSEEQIATDYRNQGTKPKDNLVIRTLRNILRP